MLRLGIDIPERYAFISPLLVLEMELVLMHILASLIMGLSNRMENLPNSELVHAQCLQTDT